MFTSLLASAADAGGTFDVTLTPQMLALVPLVLAVVRLLRTIPLVDRLKAWTPVLTLAISVALAFAVGLDAPVVAGLLIGLASGGGYDLLRVPGKVKANGNGGGK